MSVSKTLLKCPITSCEYFNDKIIIGTWTKFLTWNRVPLLALNILFLFFKGFGPYLSLIDDLTFEELSKSLLLKYRVIHKIVINENHPDRLICVFGQKAFTIVRLDDKNQFVCLLDTPIELSDWIFDIFWTKSSESENSKIGYDLVIVCAHNQCVVYSLDEKRIKNSTFCAQKCMLYYLLNTFL